MLKNREIALMLKESGCKQVSFGIESGDEEYRKTFLKRNYSNLQILTAAELLHEVGIPFSSYNIMGFPFETIKQMEESLSRYLREHEQNLFHFLDKLVLQPSYSKSKQDVDMAGRLITEELSGLDLCRELYKQDETGDHLLFRTPACKHHPRSILLVGHMDTVFPPGAGFNWYKQENGKTYGPGVIDMKGGLASAIFALKALGTANLLEEIPITLICVVGAGIWMMVSGQASA